MRISTRIIAQDHREYLHQVANQGGEKRLARWMRWRLRVTDVFVVFAMAGFLGILGYGLYQRDLASRLMERPFLLAMVILGLLLSVFAVAFLRSTKRLRRRIKAESEEKSIDETGLRDGINVGTVDFDADESGISVSVAHVQSRLPWRAFQRVQETKENFHLVIDQGAALIVPKRGVDDTLLQSFRGLMASKIANGNAAPEQ